MTPHALAAAIIPTTTADRARTGASEALVPVDAAQRLRSVAGFLTCLDAAPSLEGLQIMRREEQAPSEPKEGEAVPVHRPGPKGVAADAEAPGSLGEVEIS